MRKLCFLLGLIFFFARPTIFAQNTLREQAVLTERCKTLVKLNLASFFVGDASLHVERVFSESFSLELGVGMLLPYFMDELTDVFTDETFVTQPKTGYSISVFPRHYIEFTAPQKLYVGVELKHRRFVQEHGTTKDTEASVSGGSQFVLWENLMLDVGLRFGFRSVKSSDLDLSENFELARPFHLKLSYLIR